MDPITETENVNDNTPTVEQATVADTGNDNGQTPNFDGYVPVEEFNKLKDELASFNQKEFVPPEEFSSVKEKMEEQEKLLGGLKNFFSPKEKELSEEEQALLGLTDVVKNVAGEELQSKVFDAAGGEENIRKLQEMSEYIDSLREGDAESHQAEVQRMENEVIESSLNSGFDAVDKHLLDMGVTGIESKNEPLINNLVTQFYEKEYDETLAALLTNLQEEHQWTVEEIDAAKEDKQFVESVLKFVGERMNSEETSQELVKMLGESSLIKNAVPRHQDAGVQSPFGQIGANSMVNRPGADKSMEEQRASLGY